MHLNLIFIFKDFHHSVFICSRLRVRRHDAGPSEQDPLPPTETPDRHTPYTEHYLEREEIKCTFLVMSSFDIINVDIKVCGF